MLLVILRIFLVMILSIGVCVFGIMYCFLRPFHVCHTATFGHLFGSMAPIFGLKVEVRNRLGRKIPKSCVYIANHQNNYDMFTVARVIQPRTIMVGKKSLLWIPLFGQLYWLSGNIFIDRARTSQMRSTFMKIIKIIRTRSVSVWIFPEGTRSRGRGLLPFKTGAFYTAVFAKIPIVVICVSNISDGRIKLNRWTNGLVIIEIMSLIDTQQYDLTQVRWITKYCYNIMRLKIIELNKEVISQQKN